MIFLHPFKSPGKLCYVHPSAAESTTSSVPCFNKAIDRLPLQFAEPTAQMIALNVRLDRERNTARVEPLAHTSPLPVDR